MAVIATVITLCLMSFAGRFEDTARVTVAAPRSGLVLNPDAKVKVRGVEIGRVAAVENTATGALVVLDIDPESLKLVPANVSVDIHSSTVFGAKYIDFTVPAQPSRESLKPGAVIPVSNVIVEFNTLFQHLSDVLVQVEPEKLNATLQAIGAALEGRGDRLGGLLVDSDTVLRELNPALPALRHDLRSTTAVTGLYSDTLPNLLRTNDNAAVTAAALVDSQPRIDALLANLIGLADTATPILAETESPLVEALRLLRPTSETLHEYRSAVNCTIAGLGTNMPLIAYLFGGGPDAAVFFNASLMPAGEPYHYPEDLPKVNATGGPHCEGVLDHVPGTEADYLVTDTSAGHVWHPQTEPKPVAGTVFELLYPVRR
ncbi:MCE family protein [Nocardia crassostreae]|uniref:MCE family protein n=1 Tax=Nocardia crassostreae TaxID=53428 RepID=UPI0014715EC8|nr:MCE family protein [Nocardia crassostreae]